MSWAIIQTWVRCNVPYQRENGCNHITCTKCKAEQCYLCQEPISGHAHFYGLNCKLFAQQQHVDSSNWISLSFVISCRLIDREGIFGCRNYSHEHVSEILIVPLWRACGFSAGVGQKEALPDHFFGKKNVLSIEFGALAVEIFDKLTHSPFGRLCIIICKCHLQAQFFNKVPILAT